MLYLGAPMWVRSVPAVALVPDVKHMVLDLGFLLKRQHTCKLDLFVRALAGAGGQGYANEVSQTQPILSPSLNRS